MRLEGERFVPTWVSGNITRVLGYSPAEALSPTWWWEHLHPDDRDAAAAGMADLAEKGRLKHQYRFRTREGDPMDWRDVCARCWTRSERRRDARVSSRLERVIDQG